MRIALRTRRHRLFAAGAATALCVGLGFAVAAPANAKPADNPSTWNADLSTVDPASSNVVTDGGMLRLGDQQARAASAYSNLRTGFAVFAPRTLPAESNTVSAIMDGTVGQGAEVAVDVRGLRKDGSWSEWTEVRPGQPAVLDRPTSTVQARLMLSAADGAAGPEVRRVELSSSTTSARPSAQVVLEGGGLTYKVFATREGLVGGTTANGHVIVERDHFVALPSRRGLSGKGSGEYSVRVCGDTKRCEWAPVWDVGPWNTKDDYWNPSDQREMWKDLAQGKPEAQAAYNDGYNGGKDQFGRKVANPAGIDLADGTFWDGVGLKDNSWVTVSYSWTGSDPAGTVKTNGGPVNVRSGPRLGDSVAGLAAHAAQVRVECQVKGDPVDGSQGSSDIWYRVAADKFLAKAYVAGASGVRDC